jgi:hypothetical protein
MQLAKVIEHVGTVRALKRIASPYVIDYRNLTDEEVKQAIVRTAPQYYFQENVNKALKECLLDPKRDVRLITPVFLKRVLLNKDDFMAPERQVEDDVIAWEQAIIDRSNEELVDARTEKGKNIDLMKFVLETAWERNQEISSDEKNLLVRIKDRLRITDREYAIIEAKLGRFPKLGNQLHTRGEIDEVRQLLQAKGLIFSLRDRDGVDFDVVPDELVIALRKFFSIEIRDYGYRQLLNHKAVRSKAYLEEVLTKCGVEPERNCTLEELQEMLLEQVSPSVVLGGLTPRDGLSMEELAKWCAELVLTISGSKAERIGRIIQFYDNLLQRKEKGEDPRAVWYQHYAAFGSRQIEFLRSQMLIDKDIEIERKFEDATRYLFETLLGHNPLTLVGTEHPDGALSYRDELIYWDNKSKETPVNLKDHLRQFDCYIKNADKKVACFLVIGPEFTLESAGLAMQYQVQNGTTITLITAEELKSLAEEWKARGQRNSGNLFPLGYLVQPGRFNRSLVFLG